MHVSRLDENTIALREVNVFCSELLHQIARNARSDDPAVRERLFGAPTGGEEIEFEEEWREFVEPELRELFLSAIQIVEGDLDGFPPEDDAEDFTLEVPVRHLDAWIHTLTQARLSLAARHGFTEDELEHEEAVENGSRALALFQMEFYGSLLECFLRLNQ